MRRTTIALFVALIVFVPGQPVHAAGQPIPPLPVSADTVTAIARRSAGEANDTGLEGVRLMACVIHNRMAQTEWGFKGDLRTILREFYAPDRTPSQEQQEVVRQVVEGEYDCPPVAFGFSPQDLRHPLIRLGADEAHVVQCNDKGKWCLYFYRGTRRGWIREQAGEQE